MSPRGPSSFGEVRLYQGRSAQISENDDISAAIDVSSLGNLADFDSINVAQAHNVLSVFVQYFLILTGDW